MVEANVKIIMELKVFLDEICHDVELRRLISYGEDDFTRQRKLPLKRLIALIVNMPKRSLSIEIKEFFDNLENGLEPCTKGAFSLQRTKLNALFFKIWNRWLVDSFYHHYGDHVQRWRSFIVQAVDGSSAYLFDKPQVKAHFGGHGNQHKSTPMARVMQVQDILNDLTVWGDIFGTAHSELSIISAHVPQLAPDSLTLFDRGFPCFCLMYLMLNEETPRNFVMRSRGNLNVEVQQFLRSPKRSKIVHLRPDRRAIEMLGQYQYRVTRETTIKVRMVKIKLPGGKQEVLLTSLYDETIYSVEDLYDIYGLRWKIETTYGKQKNQQQMEQFSGLRVVCIEQDYAAGLFVANLQSLIEKQCERYLLKLNSRRKHQYRINRNISWAYLKHQIVKLFLADDQLAILLKMEKEFSLNIEPVRPGRKYKRVFKLKRRGKYQTFTNYKRAI